MTQKVKIQCSSIKNTDIESRYENELTIEFDDIDENHLAISIDGENDSTIIKLTKREISLLVLNLQELRYEMK
jgi:VCBS repeat-containing protein